MDEKEKRASAWGASLARNAAAGWCPLNNKWPLGGYRLAEIQAKQ